MEYCPRTWNNLPMEILIMIFDHLPIDDVVSCRHVSKHWRGATDLMSKVSNEKWYTVLKGIINNHKAYTIKSPLNCFELCANTVLWDRLNDSQKELVNVYQTKIRYVHVYRDKLIAVAEKSVTYYNIETFEIFREITAEYLDFNETDEIIVRICYTKAKLAYKNTMYLTGKENIDDFHYGCQKFNREDCMTDMKNRYLDLNVTATLGGSTMRLCAEVSHSDVCLYALNKDSCYILDNRAFFSVYCWTNSRWRVVSQGRLYGSISLLADIYLLNQTIYILLKNGHVFVGYKKYENLVYKLNVHVPYNKNIPQPKMIIFDKYSVAVEVDKDEQVQFMKHDKSANVRLTMTCPNLSCGLLHGNILLLGFKDGRVEMRRKLNIEERIEPDFQFNIQDFGQPVDDLEIKALEVCEMKDCHYIMVCTVSKIYQVVMYSNLFKPIFKTIKHDVNN